jgi:hypothetical protein
MKKYTIELPTELDDRIEIEDSEGGNINVTGYVNNKTISIWLAFKVEGNNLVHHMVMFDGSYNWIDTEYLPMLDEYFNDILKKHENEIFELINNLN